MAVITVDDLVKTYGRQPAVDGVSFTVGAGEVYGLLGENGAGKTTTVEILEGHRPRTSGTVDVLGHDPATAGDDFRDRIGIVLQSSSIEQVLTVREVLTMYGRCYRRQRSVDECIERVGLADSAGQRVDRLSGGQKRRLDLALGIIGHPEVLFLDEPTTGFDPAARRGSWELIRELCSGGTTVLLTSHYLDEVEYLSDRVGVLVRGKMVTEGSPTELAAAAGLTAVRFRFPQGVPGIGGCTGPPNYSLASLGSARNPLWKSFSAVDVSAVVGADVVAEGDVLSFTTGTPTETLHALTGWALDVGVELVDLSVSRPSLEDLFLQLTDAAAPPRR